MLKHTTDMEKHILTSYEDHNNIDSVACEVYSYPGLLSGRDRKALVRKRQELDELNTYKEELQREIDAYGDESIVHDQGR